MMELLLAQDQMKFINWTLGGLVGFIVLALLVIYVPKLLKKKGRKATARDIRNRDANSYTFRMAKGIQKDKEPNE